MLCAEDEQGRTCWMTALRLFKVVFCFAFFFSSRTTLASGIDSLQTHYLTSVLLSFAVRDCVVPELQDSAAKKNATITFFSTCGEFVSGIVQLFNLTVNSADMHQEKQEMTKKKEKKDTFFDSRVPPGDGLQRSSQTFFMFSTPHQLLLSCRLGFFGAVLECHPSFLSA